MLAVTLAHTSQSKLKLFFKTHRSCRNVPSFMFRRHLPVWRKTWFITILLIVIGALKGFSGVNHSSSQTLKFLLMLTKSNLVTIFCTFNTVISFIMVTKRIEAPGADAVTRSRIQLQSRLWLCFFPWQQIATRSKLKDAKLLVPMWVLNSI